MMNGFKRNEQQAGKQSIAQPQLRAWLWQHEICALEPFFISQAKQDETNKGAYIPEQMAEQKPVISKLHELDLQQRLVQHEPSMRMREGIPQKMRPGANQNGNHQHDYGRDRLLAKRHEQSTLTVWQPFHHLLAQSIKEPNR